MRIADSQKGPAPSLVGSDLIANGRGRAFSLLGASTGKAVAGIVAMGCMEMFMADLSLVQPKWRGWTARIGEASSQGLETALIFY